MPSSRERCRKHESPLTDRLLVERGSRPFTLSPAPAPENPSSGQEAVLRFFVAMVSHETNTFSPIPTDRRQFEAHDLRYGGEILEAYRGTGTCLGGMIDGAAAARRHPGALAGRQRLAGRARHQGLLRRGQGAPAGRSGGGGPARRRAPRPARRHGGGGPRRRRGRPARRRCGPPSAPCPSASRSTSTPTSPAPWWTPPRCCTATRPIRTSTWTRAGREAAARLADVVAGRVRPTVAYRQPPLLPPIAGQLTARGPMRRLYDLADAMERRRPRVLSISVFAGFPLADIPDAGLSVYVATDGDQALADDAGRRAGGGGVGDAPRVPAHGAAGRRTRWRARWPSTAARSCWPTSPTTPAAAPPATPPRSCASCCGSAPADVTVACLWDEAAAACVAAGVGATVTLARGRQDRSEPRRAPHRHRARAHAVGRPLRLQGADVPRLEGRLGPTAVLDVNDVKIILISNRRQTLDPEMIRVVGIDPLAEKILVVKSSDPLPRRLRADRPRHPGGRRAGAVVVESGPLRLHARAPSDLSRSTTSEHRAPGRPGERRCPLPLSMPPTSRCST